MLCIVCINAIYYILYIMVCCKTCPCVSLVTLFYVSLYIYICIYTHRHLPLTALFPLHFMVILLYYSKKGCVYEKDITFVQLYLYTARSCVLCHILACVLDTYIVSSMYEQVVHSSNVVRHNRNLVRPNVTSCRQQLTTSFSSWKRSSIPTWRH